MAKGGTSRLALAHSKFVHHSTSSFMVMDSQDSPRILLSAGRDLEHHAANVRIPVKDPERKTWTAFDGGGTNTSNWRGDTR